MVTDSDALLRKALGNNLQTGALRAILILAAFALIGAILAFLIV
jgi:hypothetical protein